MGELKKKFINFVINFQFMLLKFYFFLLFFLTSCQFLIKNPPPSLSWPLKNQVINQKFAPIWNSSHQGIDLKAQLGTPVFSSHSGRVIYAGQRFSGYGKVVIVEFSNYWSSLYAHLNEIKVQEGQTVKQGALIGTVGRTGKVTGVHLHFELIYKKQPVNPLLYLK